MGFLLSFTRAGTGAPWGMFTLPTFSSGNQEPQLHSARAMSSAKGNSEESNLPYRLKGPRQRRLVKPTCLCTGVPHKNLIVSGEPDCVSASSMRDVLCLSDQTWTRRLVLAPQCKRDAEKYEFGKEPLG